MNELPRTPDESQDELDSPRGLEKEAEWEKELLLWSNSL